MKKIFPLFIVLITLLCCLVFSTCSKDYSYEGGPITGNISPAKYSIVSNGGACTDATVSGNYYVDTALNATNIVELQADVTTPGTYNLTTTSLNGVQFSASGYFTGIGKHTVILTGHGKPIAEGNYSFTTSDSSKCLFSITFKKASVPVARFILAGAPYNCESAIVSGYYVAAKPLDNYSTVSIKVNVTATGAYKIGTDTLDGISFSSAGTFTSIGEKTVILTGNGTPTYPRNLVFNPLGDSSSCTFNIAVSNPQPVATYVLQSAYGTPAPCVYAVSGEYAAGTPLSAANTVTVSVYVTELGYFTIATNEVNGMSFAYTGEFTSKGGQSVVLSGTGTPAAKGGIGFTPQIVGPHPIGGEACAFSVSVK